VKPPRKASAEELHAAYVAHSGYPVSLNRQRRLWLAEIAGMQPQQPFTAEDVRAVLAGILWHVKKGTSGYGESSLYCGNAMRPETFEERALACRAKALRRVRKEAPPVAQTDCLGTTRLVPAPEPETPRADFVAGFGKLKRDLLQPGADA